MIINSYIARFGSWRVALLLLVSAFTASGCAPAAQSSVLKRAPQADAPNVMVLRSNNSAVFEAPLKAFVGGIDAHVTLLPDVNELDAGTLRAEMARIKPALLVVFGSSAASFAKAHVTDVPVLFAMVINYRRHGLDSMKNAMGIALETPPIIEFSQFKLIAPTMKRVLAFYTKEQSSTLITIAKTDLATLGMALVAVEVADADAVASAYEAQKKSADALWLLNDSIIMNPKTFATLRDRAVRDHLPLICSLSEEFTQQGALMSVSVDFTSLGAQAAVMAKRVLFSHDAASQVGVQPPIGTKLVVNLKVAKEIGLQVPDDVMPFISKVIANQQ